jgi:putative transposase
MTSPTAIEYGIPYHIFTRGTNRENIFKEEGNYYHFMALFAHHVAPIAETYSYCLLHNHLHLFLRIRTKLEIAKNNEGGEDTKILLQTSPGQHFSNLFNAYAKTINNAFNRTGSLFQHPFGRIPVTNQKYYFNLIRYIHQNPQHHGFVKDFREWPFSSFHTLHSRENQDFTGFISLTEVDTDTGQFEPRLKSPELGLLGPLIISDFF